MFTMKDYRVEAERRRDQIAQAEEMRVVRLAEAGREQTGGKYQRLLAWLGAVLENLGRHLQARYSGTTSAAPDLSKSGASST